MANSHTRLSAFLPIKSDDIKKATDIVAQVVIELEKARECCTIDVQVTTYEEQLGLWFKDIAGSADMEHMDKLGSAIIDSLGIDEPFLVEWAITCDVPRIHSFGGGAMLISRGRPTIYCYPGEEVQKAANFPRTYAQLGWRAADVTSVNENMTEEQAERWLSENEKRIRDELCSKGFMVIANLLGS